MPFILYCAHLALSLHKIGIGSAIKIKVFQPFVLYCAHLALSLQKIGSTSTIQVNLIVFGLHYLCKRINTQKTI